MIVLSIVSADGADGAASFFDITSIFIVIGCLIASLLINIKMDQIKLTNKVLKEAFRQNDQRLPELIELFFRLSERARREGLLSLEDELHHSDDPFIRKGIIL